MALHWDVSNVANSDNVCFRDPTEEERKCYGDGRHLTAATHSLIMVSMVLAYGPELTEKNLGKAWERLRFYERLFGALRKEYDSVSATYECGACGVTNGRVVRRLVDKCFTYEELKAHIGLRTNVAPETDAKWFKRMTEDFRREEANAVKRKGQGDGGH